MAVPFGVGMRCVCCHAVVVHAIVGYLQPNPVNHHRKHLLHPGRCCPARPRGRYRPPPSSRGTFANRRCRSYLEMHTLGLVSGSGLVDASKRTSVSVRATAYDRNDSSNNGCDPKGCRASNTRDGDLDDESRWSCKFATEDKKCRLALRYGKRRTWSR